MNQYIKRITALCLLVALVFGLVGGVPFPKASAAESTSGISTESTDNLLPNPSFEELDSKGMPANWMNWNGLTALHSIVTAKENPDLVYEGNHSLKLSVPADAKVNGVKSVNIPIEKGKTYRLSAYVKESFTSGSGFQVYLEYLRYNEEKKTYERSAAFYVTTPVTGEWNYLEVIGAAPEDAVYVRVLLVPGAGRGDVYFDNLTLTDTGRAEYAPEMFDGQWSQIYNEYPRLKFDKAGLESIKNFSLSEDICAYGYSGADALESLIASADKYLAETELKLTYLGEVPIVYPLHPVLADPTNREEMAVAPTGYSNYPYLTSFGSNMVSRMQTLALAYAVTGNVEYGNRAKQYALDICKWERWVGFYETGWGASNEKTSQASGYFLDCVMLGYDMCHDLFTEEELAFMDAKILSEGLENLYADCWPRMNRDRDMDHATGLILASCLIMNENNVAQLKKYLDMGMTYVNWRLNYFLKSGVNEGHMYDSLAIDDIVVSLYTLQRVTGYEGPFDHPYMDELEKRVLGFFEMTDGTLPAYSDSQYKSTYYPYSMAVFSQQGNELATYYLAVGNALSSAYDQLTWHTDKALEDVVTPDDRVGNVTYLGSHGQGALRTGWGTLDSLLVINANNTDSSHNHYDQNSIQFAFNGKWLLNDSEYKDNAYTELTQWEMKYTNSTIFVDGKPQNNMGKGSLQQVFNTHVYGYMIGSAPGAYGMEDRQAVLNKFDRHVIMLNHDSKPYYIIIDDLDSNKDRNFGWNFYTNGKLTKDSEAYTGYWDQVEMDGKPVTNGTSATGNRLTLSRYGLTLHSYFVGRQVTTKEVSYAGYGPTLLVENSTASKNYQFMNILSVENNTQTQYTTKFADLVGQDGKVTLNLETGLSYELGSVNNEEMVMFTVEPGKDVSGPGIDFKFEVPEDGEYFVTVDIGQTMYSGDPWNVYISGIDKDEDGRTDCLSLANRPIGPEGILVADCGKQYLTKGEHIVSFRLSGKALEGATVALGGINLRKANATMGEGTVKVLESYDNGDLLGAKIAYGPVLSDLVLFNRGTGVITGGGLTTNGQQATVLGLNGTDISEGYAVTNGTSLKYGELVLMTANGPVSIAVDYTMAKLPVKNGEEEPKIHKDFNELDPVFYISSKAEAETTVSFYLGMDVNYTAMVDGVAVASTYDVATGMLTMTVPAGEHQITVSGGHHHVWADPDCITPKTCSLCGLTEGEPLGHTWIEATCTTNKICSVCNFVGGGPVHMGIEGEGCLECGKVFGYCSDYVTWTLENGILTISGYGAMPDFAQGNTPWYSKRTSITGVVIEDGITKISQYAFYNCTKISNVIMSDDVTEIGNSAFRGCTALKTVTVGTGVTTIATRAFYGCTALQRINIPANVENIAIYAFYNCKALAEIVYCGTAEQWAKINIANSNDPVKNAKLSYHAWVDATCTVPKTCELCGLTEGVASHTWVDATCMAPKTCIDCGITEGTTADHNWLEATCIVPKTCVDCGITEGTTTDHVWVGGSCTAPDHCSNCGATGTTKDHNVQNGVCTYCGKYGTCGTNLTWTLSADGTLTISGTGAMADYSTSGAPWSKVQSSIKRVIIEDGVTTIGKYAFYKCASIANVSVGADVISVGYGAFQGCSALTSIALGAKVTIIDSRAFFQCSSLTTVFISGSLTEVGTYGFYGCNALSKVYFCGTADQWSAISFGSQNTKLTSAARFYHEWTEATCSAPKTCTICGQTEGTALDHAYESVTTAPTCTVAGKTTYTCSVCGHSYEEEVPAAGHTEEIIAAVAPTCTATGLTEGKKCAVCGEILQAQEVVDALDHTYESVVTAPTCTVAGKTTYTCSACGHSYEKEIPAAGHTEEIIAAVAPTCTTTGLTEGKKCSVCGEILVEQQIVDALGHSYTSEYHEPTYESNAYTHYVCSVCGHSYDEVQEGTQLFEVAQIADQIFASLEAALEAAKPGDTVILLRDATIARDTVLAAGVTYEIPQGLTLTVAEGATVTADSAATLNCAGTIVVAGYADISDLLYGKTFGAKGGKLTVKSTGTVVMLDQWVGVWTPLNDALLGSMLKDCESGAKTVVGEDTWTLTDISWTHELHTYVDGVCTGCGAAEEVAPTIDENLTIVSKDMLLGGYIGAQFTVNPEVTGNYDAIYIVVEFDGQEFTYNVPLFEGAHVFEHRVAPKYMGEALKITAYGVKDDVTYTGITVEWSIKDGIMERLAKFYPYIKYAQYRNRCILLVDMLYYGAEAQIRFGTDGNGLVTDGLDAGYAALKTATEPTIEKVNTATKTSSNQLYQVNLGVEDAVQMQFTFRLKVEDYSQYVVKITANGTTHEYTGESFIPQGTSSTLKKFVTVVFDKLEAVNMRDEITVELWQNGALVSASYTMSIEGFATASIAKGENVALLKSMIAYGDSAKISLG